MLWENEAALQVRRHGSVLLVRLFLISIDNGPSSIQERPMMPVGLKGEVFRPLFLEVFFLFIYARPCHLSIKLTSKKVKECEILKRLETQP